MSELILKHDIITKEQQDNIEKLTTSQQFPWFFSQGTILPQDVQENDWVINSGSNPFQFVHGVSLNSNYPFVDVISPVLNAIALEFQSNLKIIKVKFNLLTRSNEHTDHRTYHLPHTDTDENESCLTSIYYVNDSDGDTYLFNEFGPKSKHNKDLTILKRVSPTKGSLLVFDARRFHASSSPIFNDKRIIMNVVFKVHTNE